MKSSLLVTLFFSLPAVVFEPASAADVSYYGVIKSVQYEQTNDGAPSLLATNPYSFNAFAVASTNNVLTNITCNPPLHSLLPDDPDGISWRYMEQFNSQGALDAAYPNGSILSPVHYTVTMYTKNDGVKAGALNFFLLVVPISYPATPGLTNLAAAQEIDSTRDFHLGWNPLGGSTLAIVQLTVLDTASNVVYMSPAPFQPGALSGASLSMVIPAYALPAGANLVGHLTIANPGLPNTNAYAGATGISAVAKDTQFSMATRPLPLAPRLTIARSPAGQIDLCLEGEPNRLYQIEAACDFTAWTNLLTTNSQTGVVGYTDFDSKNFPQRCYRGKVGQ